TDRPPFQPMAADLDASGRNAFEKRTDLPESKKTMDANDVSVKFLRNQTLPEGNTQFHYGLTGIGGVQAVRGQGLPGPVLGTTELSHGSVLGDVFANNYPKRPLTLTVNSPLGNSRQETSLARAKLQVAQSQTQLKNQQLQVATQVREAARALTTNQ